jgi:PLP dependent protein
VFGENYVQELVEKAAEMEQHKDDIQWHFIGGLQSNKANMLVKGVVPYGKLVVETVGSVKVANKLDNAMSDYSDNGTKKLEVFVQINTSGEDSKSGIAVEDMDDVISTCKHIFNDCDNLTLKGIMTIGAPGDVSCLDKLDECRTAIATALDLDDPKKLELSMGMSGDYEVAIAKGSTNVRVGSTIFGARDYSNVK